MSAKPTRLRQCKQLSHAGSMRLRASVILLFASMAACAPQTRPASPKAHAGSSLADVRRVTEQSVRELAAADARIAKRAHLEPTQADLARAMQASLAAEESAALLSGAPDPFTRAPRIVALERAHARSAGLAPREAGARLELAALQAVLREERARLERESQLPAASSRLIRAMAALEPPRSTLEMGQNDAALSRRLGEVEDALDTADSLDCDGIEDALDDLEPFVGSVYPEAEKSLTSLRLACGQALPAARGKRALPPLASAPTALAKARWIALRSRIRNELQAYQAPAESVRSGEREAETTQLLFERAPCVAPAFPPGLGPSSERAFGCGALARARDDAALLRLVIHDLLTLGLWSLELAEERHDYRRVLSLYAMAGRVSAEVGSKLARKAAAEPEIALRAGLLGEQLATLEPAARPKWIRDYLAGGLFLPAELGR